VQAVNVPQCVVLVVGGLLFVSRTFVTGVGYMESTAIVVATGVLLIILQCVKGPPRLPGRMLGWMNDRILPDETKEPPPPPAKRDCPSCGARPGERCKGPDGNELLFYHPERKPEEDRSQNPGDGSTEESWFD